MRVFMELEKRLYKKICQKTAIWNTATGKTNIWRKLSVPHYLQYYVRRPAADQTAAD